MMDTAALEAIKRLKYAYFRTLDLKQFEALGALLTEDATSSYEDGKTVLEGREAIVRWLVRGAGRPRHRDRAPRPPSRDRRSPRDTEAEGTWYLQDRVIVPLADVEISGTAFYADRYRLTDAGWLHQPHRVHSASSRSTAPTRPSRCAASPRAFRPA